MKSLSIAVFTFLWCSSCTQLVHGCDDRGPETCTLGTDFCSWEDDGNFYLDKYAAWLSLSEEEGQLVSRSSCSTLNKTYCLSFSYKIDVNNTIDLSVSIRHEGSDKKDLLMWTMSASPEWNKAKIPFVTSTKYVVLLDAKRRRERPNSNHTVGIHSILLKKDDCEFLPISAKPRPATTTTSVSQTTDATTTGTEDGQYPTSTTTARASSEDSSNKTIVGVVISVLVVVFIAVMVFFLFKRKKLRFCKMHCRSQGRKNDFPKDTAKADDEDFYEIKEDDTRSTHRVESDNKNCPQNTEGQGSQNEYHVPAAEPIRATQGQNGVYHILEEDPELNDSSAYQAQNRDSASMPQGQTAEYNSLDFDGKSYVPVKSEGATSAVYSHVTEGGDDTYSHVDRDKKVKVIDDEYSHIK